jgi:hypothetical protein
MSRRKHTVDYNQTGYAGDAMSLGAVQAYHEGAMPISRWTKAALTERIVELGGSELCGLFTLAQLRERFLTYHSWHHTGVYANATDFFCVDEAQAQSCTEEAMRLQFGEAKADRYNERLQTRASAEPREKKPRLKDTWVNFSELPEKRIEFVRTSKSGNRVIRVHSVNNKGEAYSVEGIERHFWGLRFRIPYEEYEECQSKET